MAFDMLKQPLAVGDRVARAYRAGNRAYLEIRTVRSIESDRLFLDDSHVPIYRTDNLLILKE